MNYLNPYDILLSPIYILFILFWANVIKKNKIISASEYSYFVPGILAKIIGALALGTVYMFYYGGGDTLNYFNTAVSYSNLLSKESADFFTGWFGDAGVNTPYMFDEETGYPVYSNQKDHHAFFIVRLLIPIAFLGFKSYFPMAILVSVVSFTGNWKLYKVFITEFPNFKKELAYCILFVPSVIFWGSGIMKDSFTFCAVGWFTYGFYFFFIRKKRSLFFLLYCVLAAAIILSIKPYILFALLPGSIIWLSNNAIQKIENNVLRKIFAPILLSAGALVAFLALLQLDNYLGKFKFENVLNIAAVSQKDQKQDYYGGNSFDIGEFDPSIQGASSKAHLAIFAGIFRPTIFDVRNAVMLVSAIENTVFLLITLFLLFKLKFFGLFRVISANPMIQFSLIFSLFFAFSVGLSVSNFGTLVRLRIPEIPFFLSSIVLISSSISYNKKLKPKQKST